MSKNSTVAASDLDHMECPGVLERLLLETQADEVFEERFLLFTLNFLRVMAGRGAPVEVLDDMEALVEASKACAKWSGQKPSAGVVRELLDFEYGALGSYHQPETVAIERVFRKAFFNLMADLMAGDERKIAGRRRALKAVCSDWSQCNLRPRQHARRDAEAARIVEKLI